MTDFDREATRRYLERLMNKPVHRHPIKAITVNPLYHGAPRMRIEVGHTVAGMEPDAPPQRVLAIFESTSFLVVTPERGNGVGLPYIFTRQEVTAVERG
jgi:hypothetical protein